MSAMDCAHGCGQTPHAWSPAPEAGEYWRCSECGGITLTVNEAKRLADSWQAEQLVLTHTATMMAPPLDTDERKALLGWVRRQMERCMRAVRARYPDDQPDHEGLAYAVVIDLGITIEQALDLCEAAGWPS